MADRLSPEQRSKVMYRIRGKDTKIEVLVRSGLHRRGYRFRVHRRDLPGRPDLVLPKHRAVIFVNGCFWHGHGCRMSKMPSTNREFWATKIQRTQERDRNAIEQLREMGWRVLTIWECSLRGRDPMEISSELDRIDVWIRRGDVTHEISGGTTGTLRE